MVISRLAVRIACLDGQQRVLLLRWRDPYDGRQLWEPPGGGVEAGESFLDAARRELTEETCLSGDAVIDRHTMVARDVSWNGARYVGEEAFFLARFDSTPVVGRDGLQGHESPTLQGHRWVPWSELDRLEHPLEPPDLVAILARLDPNGPWTRQ